MTPHKRPDWTCARCGSRLNEGNSTGLCLACWNAGRRAGAATRRGWCATCGAPLAGHSRAPVARCLACFRAARTAAKVERAPQRRQTAPMHPPEPCTGPAHQWRLEEPDGHEVVLGVCRLCGAKQRFGVSMSAPGMVNPHRVASPPVNGHGRADVEVRLWLAQRLVAEPDGRR